MLKKITVLCLSLVMIMSTMCSIALAETRGTNSPEIHIYTDENNIIYEYTVLDNEATITKITTTQSNLTIPETIDGYTVVEIGENCCTENEYIHYITIPGTVKEIDTKAFLKCRRVRRLYLSEGLEIIGDEAFSNFVTLEELTIPNTVKKMGERCFAMCLNLQSIVFPENIPEIGEKAFSDSNSLEEVNIDSQNSDFDFRIFGTKTPWLKNEATKNEYLLTDGGKTLFKYSGSSEEFTVPEGVVTIGDSAFKDTDVKRVFFPNSVKKIDNSAFYRTTNLESIDFGKNVEYIGNLAFYGSNIKEIQFPDNLVNIGESAFSGCLNPKSITIPSSVKNIGSKAFYGCETLKSVTIQTTGLNFAGRFIFCSCPSLTEVTLPSSFTYLSEDNNISTMFENIRDNIKTVNYSGELTELIYDMFQKSEWINKFYDDNGFIIIGDTLISYNGKNKSVVIPDGIKTIERFAFRDKDIDEVSFSKSVEIINAYAFSGSKLKKVVIPSNIKTVSERAFCINNELKSVVIEEGVGEILGEAFEGCDILSEVTIPKGTFIAPNAFEDTPYSLGETAAPTATNKPTATDKPIATAEPAATDKPTATAEPASKLTVENVSGGVAIKLDDKYVSFTDVKPFIDENDRTQAPVRAVSEALGCKVEWDNVNRTVKIEKGNKIVEIIIGKEYITADGKTVQMDTAAKIVNDRTFIPVRFIAEALGLEVVWGE